MPGEPWVAADETGTLRLTVAGALGLYAQIVGCREREAGEYLRSRGGLSGALSRPRNAALYEHADLALQAAYLARGIAESQLFVDGNKRLALVCMITFLELNGYTVDADEETVADWIIDLAGDLTVEQLGTIVREHMIQVE